MCRSNDFGGIDSSDEFGFIGADSNGRLDLGLVGTSSTGETEAITGDRAASLGASGVRGINKSSELRGARPVRKLRSEGSEGRAVCEQGSH